MNRGAPIPDTVTLHVPFRIVKRGGRKEMQLPDGAEQPRTANSTFIKALARAFRWKRMLDSGEFASIADLAEHERIAAPYLTRVLRLTLLAPEIVEAILDGRQNRNVRLESCESFFPSIGCSRHLGLRNGRDMTCSMNLLGCSFCEPLSDESAAQPKNCA